MVSNGVCVVVFLRVSSPAAVDLRPHPGGEGGQHALPGDAGQPQPATAVPHRGLLLHHDVHGVQRAARRQVSEHTRTHTHTPTHTTHFV